jgi:uncharacterized membrane protein YfcA
MAFPAPLPALLLDWRPALDLGPGTLWLCFASLMAGLLNAVAGGGSFLSFPALLGLGVLPIQANATNTVALWPGQFTSIVAYWQDLMHNRKLVLPLAAAAVVGGATGGIVLLHTPQGAFLRLVPWLLLVAASLFAVSGPVSRWLQARTRGHKAANSRPSMLPLCASVLFVTVYIGYFGAGAGFLIISVLALFGVENINQINALKVVTTTCANGIAVLVFIANRQVLWQHCLLMMVTGACGGYLGGRYGRRADPRIMRIVVVALGYGMSAYFFWRG